MPTPTFTTQISSQVARAIARALLETGDEAAHLDFAGALARPLPQDMLEIYVTPRVTAAMLALVNGGQLAALVGSGVSSQEVFALAMDWQRRLSQPQPKEGSHS